MRKRTARQRALSLPNYLTPTDGGEVAFKEPPLAELARVIKAGTCTDNSMMYKGF
jgi:hypothetical protein